jgi:parallel beta-helix repeat protein
MAFETIYIRANGSVEPFSAPIQRSGNIYTLTSDINSDIDGIVVERNDTILNGARHRLQGMNVQFSRGVYLSGVSNVTVKNITITSFENGILLDAYSVGNLIIDNKLVENNYGVSCWAYSDNNTVIGNNITENNLAGIWIAGSSNETILSNYLLNNNQYGIILESSANDTIYHNNFVNNTNQLNIYDSTGAWDNGYPSSGNYWNDYVGVDMYSGPNQNQPGSDGIGDTPYNCSENNQDNYPLMQIFNNIKVQPLLPPKTIVGQGYNYSIQIQLENQGWQSQTTSVTVYIDTTVLSTFTSLAMSGREQRILNSTWQTATYAKGNYTIRLVAAPRLGEVDTTDDSFNWTVHLGLPGDVSGSTQGAYDGIVNMRDISYTIAHFNSRPNSTNWKPNTDVNDDFIVNMRDISIAILNFNKHE